MHVSLHSDFLFCFDDARKTDTQTFSLALAPWGKELQPFKDLSLWHTHTHKNWHRRERERERERERDPCLTTAGYNWPPFHGESCLTTVGRPSALLNTHNPCLWPKPESWHCTAHWLSLNGGGGGGGGGGAQRAETGRETMTERGRRNTGRQRQRDGGGGEGEGRDTESETYWDSDKDTDRETERRVGWRETREEHRKERWDKQTLNFSTTSNRPFLHKDWTESM